MTENAALSRLPDRLLPWYAANRRLLPWRADREPYHIWVSEIMLQQTRVEAVKGYYARFLAALPDIAALAAADDALLHKLWEGLGYYSRVRNLKKAAVLLVQQYGGRFPRDYDAVRALPGIGDYTAGAICSIAFDLPTPAVDGNVLRVFARLTADTVSVDTPAYKRAVRERLAAVYPPEAGNFTQALMELGATVCGPNRAPDCCRCPLAELCLANRAGIAQTLPVRAPKRARREEEKTVLLLRCGDRYALCKRPGTGLLAGLWEFPNVPGLLTPQSALEAAQALGAQPAGILRTLEKTHIFTHITWRMRGVYMEAKRCTGAFVWHTADEIAAHDALPTAFRQFWDAWDDISRERAE